MKLVTALPAAEFAVLNRAFAVIQNQFSAIREGNLFLCRLAGVGRLKHTLAFRTHAWSAEAHTRFPRARLPLRARGQ